MNFWKTYVNQESKGCIIQPENINKAPAMHHSLIKQSIRHSFALEGTFCCLAEHKTIIIILWEKTH